MKTAKHLESEKQKQLVRIKRAAQITLPPEVRKRFGLVEGDYLEVMATKSGILLRPVSVVARQFKVSRTAKKA
jgi:AbrB family looped-hinge helix DNA binding protein